MKENQKDVFTRRMFIKGISTSFGALPVFAWPRWAQAFYYNLGFFKKGSASSLYVEDVFSTYLYTGTGAAQTITNNIDLAGKGGLVWTRYRNNSANHSLIDTIRGGTSVLNSNLTNTQTVDSAGWDITSFSSNGYSLAGSSSTAINNAGGNFVSWTFRKAAKFFDVVTYTGNGGTQAISHALGTTPGMVIIKRTNAVSDWVVGHRGSGSYWASETLRMNTTAAGTINGEFNAWSSMSVTVAYSAGLGDVNTSGQTYIMYLFAHDTAADGLIQCGAFTTDASGNASVTLGWEPQFAITRGTAGGVWTIQDSSRGMPVGTQGKRLMANDFAVEDNATLIYPSATGFTAAGFTPSATYIYLAIRRGLMKTPTSGTQVYQAVVQNGTSTNPRILTGVAFPPDMMIISDRQTTGAKHIFYDRLRGPNSSLASYGAWKDNDLFGGSDGVTLTQDGVTIANIATALNGSVSFVHHFFRRAPGFFDQVCYTGNGVSDSTQITHGLGVVPEMIIYKSKTAAENWVVWHKSFSSPRGAAVLNSNSIQYPASAVFNNPPTQTQFNVRASTGSSVDTNTLGVGYVAYLFASCSGVSKVGTYTGNGSNQTISCGFTTGARFVMIKRIDAAGDWLMWDTARGIPTGTGDLHLSFNSLSAEVSSDSINVVSSGFFVGENATTSINASGATYIFMAIA